MTPALTIWMIFIEPSKLSNSEKSNVAFPIRNGVHDGDDVASEIGEWVGVTKQRTLKKEHIVKFLCELDNSLKPIASFILVKQHLLSEIDHS